MWNEAPKTTTTLKPEVLPYKTDSDRKQEKQNNSYLRQSIFSSQVLLYLYNFIYIIRAGSF